MTSSQSTKLLTKWYNLSKINTGSVPAASIVQFKDRECKHGEIKLGPNIVAFFTCLKENLRTSILSPVSKTDPNLQEDQVPHKKLK